MTGLSRSQIPPTQTKACSRGATFKHCSRAEISPLGDDLKVICEEFCDWEESSRRIDLLCIDKEGSIVVVELKRTEDGGHMELQAIRYAAMISSMTLEQAITAHAHFVTGDDAPARARKEILES
jgi:hypothetical protein